MNLCRIDCVTHIVSCTVLNVCDKILALAKLLQNDLYNVDISHFVVSTDVVNLANSTLVNNKVDSTAVVLNVEPVANVNALTVNREWLVVKRIRNHKRNELFWEVVRTVVV